MTIKDKLKRSRKFDASTSVGELLELVEREAQSGTLIIHFGDGARFCGAELETPVTRNVCLPLDKALVTGVRL